MQTIQEELRQTRPFGSKALEASVSLLRTAELVRRSVAAVIEPRGITLQQYNVLRILRGAGEHGLPTLEIVDRMIEETPGITRLIDRLEARSLVVRERCKTDRRQVFCRIQPAGMTLLAELDAPMKNAEKGALGSLGKGELIDLVTLLDRAREALRSSIAHQRALNLRRETLTSEKKKRRSK